MRCGVRAMLLDTSSTSDREEVGDYGAIMVQSDSRECGSQAYATV